MNAKILMIGAAAIFAGAQFISASAIGAPASDSMVRGSAIAGPGGKPPPYDQRMLPLAGVTQAQAISTWQALAKGNHLSFSDKDAEEGLRNLSDDNIDCDRLGLLCPLVGKERVPGIIRATWQAELRTADFNETMAAFDRAVASAAQQNGRPGKLEPKDKRQIQWIFGWPKTWDVIH